MSPARRIYPCGTTPAYKRHLKNGEEACDACKKAVRDLAREQRAAARLQRELGEKS